MLPGTAEPGYLSPAMAGSNGPDGRKFGKVCYPSAFRHPAVPPASIPPVSGDSRRTTRDFGGCSMNVNELNAVAKAMVGKGKGILAADESGPTIKKRFDTIDTES